MRTEHHGHQDPLNDINPLFICKKCQADARREFVANPNRRIQFTYCKHKGFGLFIQGEAGRITRADHNKYAVFSLTGDGPRRDDLSPEQNERYDEKCRATPGGDLYALQIRESKEKAKAILREYLNEEFERNPNVPVRKRSQRRD